MTEKDFKQIFPLGEKNDAYAQYFVGQSYLSMLTTERVGIANVTFEPGCRNNWHMHGLLRLARPPRPLSLRRKEPATVRAHVLPSSLTCRS